MKKMLSLSLDVPVAEDALEALEVDLREPGARGFRVAIGGETFALEVRHLPELAPYAGSVPEEPRRPSDVDVLSLVAGLFFHGVKGGAA